jgi:uncharacterized surface protein with fasciclin (FAS1) repeats
MYNSLHKLKDKFPSTYSLFVPDNSAFHVLHPVELAYLKTHFGRHDRKDLIHRHASKEILYNQNLKQGGNVSSLEGQRIYYKKQGNHTIVDNATITQSDIVARNGTSFTPQINRT